MMNSTWTRKLAVGGLLLATVAFAQPVLSTRTQAAVVETDETIDGYASDADRARVAEFLTREDVRKQLVAMGVNPDEALARVGTMTQVELANLSAKIDALPAGQGSSTNIVVILLLIVLILVLV